RSADPNPGVVRQILEAHGRGRHPAALMDTLFQVLVQNSSDAIIMVDASGAILFASESASRIGGYTLEERVGRSALENIHPDDVATTRAGFEECVRRPGVPVAGEFR